MMESPDEGDASEMACPMVLQAVWGDVHLLLSLPLTPLTYHVLLARAVGGRAKNSAITSRLVWMRLMTFLPVEIIDTGCRLVTG